MNDQQGPFVKLQHCSAAILALHASRAVDSLVLDPRNTQLLDLARDRVAAYS
jgi:hypothetical protein